MWRQGGTRPSNTYPPQILRCPSTLQRTHSVRCETTCPARRAEHGILQTPASLLERICCIGRMVVRHTALVRADGASLSACVACIHLGGASKPLAPKQRRLLGCLHRHSARRMAIMMSPESNQRHQKVYMHAPGCVHLHGRAGSAAAGGGASADCLESPQIDSRYAQCAFVVTDAATRHLVHSPATSECDTRIT